MRPCTIFWISPEIFQVDHARVLGAVFGRKLAVSPQKLGFLLEQSLDQRAVQHLANRARIAVGFEELLDLLQSRVRFGAAAGRQNELRIELGQLLTRHGHRVAALDDPRLATILLGRPLAHLDLLAEGRQPIAKPFGGNASRLELGLELLDDIQVRHRVGDQCRFLGIRGSVGDLNDPRPKQVHDIELPQELVDDRGLLESGLLFRRERRGRRQNFLGQKTAEIRRPLPYRFRLQRGIEFRILVELEIIDDPLGELPRPDDLNFAVDRLRIGEQPRQHGLNIDHLRSARLDHDAGAGRIQWRQLETDDDCQHGRQNDRPNDDTTTTPQLAQQLVQIQLDGPTTAALTDHAIEFW